ncbi:MAG: DUF4189 domain-containing protein [Acidobacteria bacterium]|nr:DUF4189 domain-containing protein [Acidobacteriota bacterium]
MVIALVIAVACTKDDSSSSSTGSPTSPTAPTTTASVDRQSVVFPSTTIGTTSQTTFVITISFTGNAPLQFSEMSNSDQSTFPTTTTCQIPGTLAVNSTCSLTISFRPSGSAGSRASQIIVRTTNGGTLIVNISGSATQPVSCSVICWACTSSNTFGAIAYSPGSGACGWSNGFSSRSGAENRAIQECARGDCFSAVWFQSQCGALARASGNQWGWGLGGSQSVAESAALAMCSAR